MELRDLIVTPLLILIVIGVAYAVRPYATDSTTRRYFFPALILKMFGAIFLGVIYQFYYHGGDTFNYHTYGSRILWEAFCDDFLTGLKLFFSNGEYVKGTYYYAKQILFIHDPPSFTIIRIAAIFDLLTFSSYSATAILFSVLSFSGAWALFTTFYRRYPHLSAPIAVACLFVPSVIFWGSGLLKDTVVLASLGFLTFCIDRIFIQHRFSLITISIFVASLFTIYVIRKFVLQAFIPSAILWVYFKHLANLKSTMLKIILAPLILFIFLITAYYAVVKVGEGDSKYSLEKLAETSQITAYDIGFYTGANAGSTYSLGNPDDSFLSKVQLAPQAINVSLFRPYLWEVKNPLMLLSAIEAFLFLSITLYIVVKKRHNLIFFFTDPNSIFCLLFSVSYAFAIGMSTFNFGTLVRYKTVLLPFYLLCLVIINNYNRTEVRENAV